MKSRKKLIIKILEINQIKLIDKLKNIKSKFILEKIFNNFKKKKLLDFIKYNKKLKKRINMNVNDYKEYSEKYSSIDIEIKLVKNEYGEFIKIKDEDKIYYHIYFDSNKEEIKMNYIDYNAKIKIIKIIIDYQVKSFENLFCFCKCIKSKNFKKFYRNNINNMSFMFYKCSSLKKIINLKNFNTNNVEYMGNMFDRCSSLKELNLNNFNTANVSDMGYMFYGCSALKELNVSTFNTSNVIDMSYMFYGCSSLKKLNLNSFITNNVSNMTLMFYGCSSLNELNINNFNTTNVTNMSDMFLGCSDELIMIIKDKYKNIREEAF